MFFFNSYTPHIIICMLIITLTLSIYLINIEKKLFMCACVWVSKFKSKLLR